MFLIQDGCSPVYVASHNGHKDVVDLLVSAGADIHLATKVCIFIIHIFLWYTYFHIMQDGNVPLVVAAEKGHAQTVQRLLELGANVNHQNKVMICMVTFILRCTFVVNNHSIAMCLCCH